MSTAEVVEPELVAPDEQKEMLVVVQQTGLQADTAKNLQDSFAPLFKNARMVLEKSRSISVTDASQKLEIKLARECRLALRAIRVEGDKTRKALKEDSLRRGKAIDGFYNILLHLTEQEESRLEEQEKFVERIEAARKAQLKIDREKALAPFGVDTAFMSLSEMPDETFAQLLENSRLAHEAKLAQARKAEEERIRLENERLKEEARVREENARLKREADEREAAAKAEKARLEAIAVEERRKAAEAAEAARAEAARIKAEADAKLAEEKRIADEKARIAAEAARKEREAIEAKQRAEREAWEAKRKAEQDAAFAAAEATRKRVVEEKAKADAIAAKERQAREKAEAELRAAKEAAEKKAAEEAEAARQAALAPDKEKLVACATALRSVSIPALSTDEGRGVTSLLSAKIEKLAQWIEQEASVL